MISSPFHLLLLSLLFSLCHGVGPLVGVPVCVKEAGPANIDHCVIAIDSQMHDQQPFPSDTYAFFRASQNPCRRIPAYFRRRNCIFVVNALDNRLLARGSWATLRSEATKLMDACVERQNGAGGHMLMANGLFIAVWKPAAFVEMLLSTGGDVPMCLNFVKPAGPSWNPDGRLTGPTNMGGGTA